MATDGASQSVGRANGVRQQSRDALAKLAAGRSQACTWKWISAGRSLRLQCWLNPAWDEVNTRIALEGLGSDGKWLTISDHPALSAHAIHTSLRKAASAELKARGIRYVFLGPGDFGAADVLRFPAGWGMTPVGELEGSHIYHID